MQSNLPKASQYLLLISFFILPGLSIKAQNTITENPSNNTTIINEKVKPLRTSSDVNFNKWAIEEVAPGLKLRTIHTDSLYNSFQNINILEVDLSKHKIAFRYIPDKNVKTSVIADTTKALAAINGGFFNIQKGGSVTYIKVDGMILGSDTASRWKKTETLSAALAISKGNKIFMQPALSNGYYDAIDSLRNILITGPLLLSNGQKVALPEKLFFTKRHPRTCVALHSSGKLLLVTVDGRTSEADGMSLFELADYLFTLGCTNAINFDGGGSTTLWIRNKPYNGVVNMPSDNKRFDHEGERPVSNILIVE
ncbi:MAG: phosphodiester glycosidase family protein [Bacteroidetes bacterium]|nr:phosphodiester glycosidase family protein [Bacteroidota bacterium]